LADVYVSYRSTEQPFVSAVLARLSGQHTFVVDDQMPPGVDWRRSQFEGLRNADVFLIFVSRDTATSAFQNAELGAARLASACIDGKRVIAVLIDDPTPPAAVADLDCLDASHRDVGRTVQEIEEAIARGPARVRLFISHAHRDQDLAGPLVDAITSGLVVPRGELRCTSVPGYQLDLGAAAPEVLRREIGAATSVIALLTPNSLGAEWVLFELGAVWAHARSVIPLLAGGLEEKDVPGPLRGAAGGQLSAAVTIDRLLEQLARDLKWPPQPGVHARQKVYALADYAKAKRFTDEDSPEDARIPFIAKRSRIGRTQNALIEYITATVGTRPSVPFDELAREIAGDDTTLYYRLEQLRLLGFLRRLPAGLQGGRPVYAWTLSERYRREAHL
jgi:hypothetical protein